VADPPTVTKVIARTELGANPVSSNDCLVIIHSLTETLLGKRIELGEQALVIGRDAETDLRLPSDAVSRRHARVVPSAQGYVLEDLGSTNGTYVNGRRIYAGRLYRGDQIKIGDCVLKFLTGDDLENQFHETLHRMAMCDGLTGIYNKRYFLRTLEAEIERAGRRKRPLALVLFDVDHFKKINDTYGHLAGDAVLQGIATRASAEVRQTDCFARYGGEEFALLLGDADLESAAVVAEKIRRLVEARPFTFEKLQIPVTSSFGVAALDEGLDAQGLVQRADERLYAAKRGGRNRVVSAA
jgi:two-component system cell cycle response regulator